MMRGIRIVAVLAVLLGGTAAAAIAQAAGTVRGRVVADGTARPLQAAQVLVVGTGRGSLTNSGGQFLIAGVPAGAHIVRVQLIGYGTAELPVTVAAGQTTEVVAELATEAVALEGVVVTGQPGATRRRAIGASVAAVDAEALTERAAVSTMAQLLQGREAGVLSLGASGTAGAAGTLILRGATSINQSNAPAVYVDGVRVDATEKPLFFFTTGGQGVSRLNDLNPADIERVEVVKGAAASALYGSEASNGVVQVFTKKGRIGEKSLNMSVRLGGTRIPGVLPEVHPDARYHSPNDLLETGRYAQYSLSARGGAESIRHYLSGTYTSDEGSLPGNRFERANGLVSLSLDLAEGLTAQATSSLVWSRARLPFNDNHAFGVLMNALNSVPVERDSGKPAFGGLFSPVEYALSIDNTEETYRFTEGLTLQHDLGSRLSQRLTLGLDVVAGQGITTWPYGAPVMVPKGARWVTDRKALNSNLDYSATLHASLFPGVTSSLSAGAQVYALRDHWVYTTGADFAMPGDWLLGDASKARLGASEQVLEYTTGGVFVQEQLGFGDRLFVTGGLRVDGSSAFGEDFGLQAYPKLSASYVVSDEAWFRVPGVSSLRLRAGYGMAGTQPGAFDAQRTYTTFSALGQVALHTGAVGNPLLAPEVSHEWEGGFDAGLLGERVSLAATAYHQTTHDALLSRPVAPSTGFLSTQLVNVGKVRNAGLELSASATLLRTERAEWAVNASYAYNRNEVLEMGGVAPFEIDRFGTRVVEGYPLGGKWQPVIVGTDAKGMPVKSDAPEYLGTGLPPHTGSLGANLGWGALELFANAQWAAGHVVLNNTRAYTLQMRRGAEYHAAVIANEDNPLQPQSPAVNQLLAKSRILGEYVEDGDWLKVREVGARLSLPEGMARRVGADLVALNLSARNVFTLTRYSGADPEVSATLLPLLSGYEMPGKSQFASVSAGNDFFTLPQARQIVFGMDVRF